MADGQTPVSPIPGLDMNAINSMLGSMNLPNLAGMLNGINFNQLMPLMPTVLKMLGGGLGNPGASPLGGLFGGNPGASPLGGLFGGNPGASPLGGLFGRNPGYNNVNNYGYNYGRPAVNPAYPVANPGAVPPPFVIPPHLQNDPKFMILNAVRPLIPQDKAYIVDQIGRLLVLYVTITAFLPKRAPVAAAAPTPTPAPPPTAASSTPPALPAGT
jgi:hypothetical protein